MSALIVVNSSSDALNESVGLVLRIGDCAAATLHLAKRHTFLAVRWMGESSVSPNEA